MGYSEGDEIDLYSLRASVSTENKIQSFAIPEQAGDAEIDTVNYTVTAENGDQQEWTVTVDILTGIISDNSIGTEQLPMNDLTIIDMT